MITVNNLEFSYTKSPFISDMNFQVEDGEIFGFLGPSGAGKSTLQKILIGMLPSYEGSAMIDGMECNNHGKNFYENIGVDFEFSTLYDKLTARENLTFFGSLYSNRPSSIDRMLESVGLYNDGDKKISEYSKGMKARLNFLKAIIHNPKILFLDEPTSGLDPTNNRIMKDLILEKKAEGKTILLTTHNMEDAAELCDRVAFIVGGKIMALDTPHNLVMLKGAAKVTYTWLKDGTEHCQTCDMNKMSEDLRLKTLIAENKIVSIHSSEPNLNDIFMDITGRTLI